MICPHCQKEFEGNFCPYCGKSPNIKNKCPKCGNEFEGKFCNVCGEQIYNKSSVPQNIYINNTATATTNAIDFRISLKSKWTAFFLCLFLGFFGVHRFYVGKVMTGIIYFFTAGLLGIGWFIDLINILCGNFKDNMGCVLKN